MCVRSDVGSALKVIPRDDVIENLIFMEVASPRRHRKIRMQNAHAFLR